MSPCQSCGATLPENATVCQSCGSTTALTGDVLIADESLGVKDAPLSPNIGAKAMDTNVAGAIAYLAGLITGIVLLSLDPYKSNSFVRFHAFQSIFFNIAWMGFWIVWMILSAILTSLTAGAVGLIAVPLVVIFAIASFGIWAFLMYQAYQQNLFKLPIVGKFAAERAGVRL